jgi:MFS family permease
VEPNPLRALARVAASTTLVVLSFSMLGPVLAVRLQALGESTSAIGLFAMLPFLSVALMVPAMPWLMRRIGVSRAYRAGLILQTVATLGYATRENYTLWCAMSVLGGIGAAAAWNGTEALIAHNAPSERRGRITGLYQTALGAALAIGPFVPGVLSFDARGFMFLAAAFQAVAVMLMLSPGVGRLRASHAGAPSLGLVTALRRVPGLACIAFAGGVFEAGLSSVTTAHGAQLGLSLAAAASIADVVGVGSFALQYPSGWLADHARPRPVFVGAGILLAIASMAFALSSAQPAWMWFSAFVWGAVGGALYTLTMIRVAHQFANTSTVAGAAAMITGYTVGGAFGPALSGAVFDAFGVPGQSAWLTLLALGVIVVASRMRFGAAVTACGSTG